MVVDPIVIVFAVIIGGAVGAALIWFIFVAAAARRDAVKVRADYALAETERIRLQGDNQAERARLQGDHQEELARLQGQHGVEMTRLRGEHATEIQRLSGEHTTNVERLRGEFETARASLEATVVAAEQRYAQQVAARAEAEGVFVEATRKIIEQAQQSVVQLATAKLGEANANAEMILTKIVGPVNQRIGTLDDALKALGARREGDAIHLNEALGALKEQAKTLSEAVATSRGATDRLVNLLASSQQRGSWGEFELRRLLELSGMTEHVSFVEQEGGYGSGGGRPDAIIRLADETTIPLDAKVPLSAYQAAVDESNDEKRNELLDEAVSAVRLHVRTLAGREYHSADVSIGWTIMFVPIESMLSSCLSRAPTLVEESIAQHVLIASPLTLLVYLRAFGFGWNLARQQANVEEILTHAQTLVDRLGPFVKLFTEVGSRLHGAIESYNRATASFEGRVAVQARRIHDLGGAASPLDEVPLRESIVRLPDPARLALPGLEDVADDVL